MHLPVHVNIPRIFNNFSSLAVVFHRIMKIIIQHYSFMFLRTSNKPVKQLHVQVIPDVTTIAAFEHG